MSRRMMTRVTDELGHRCDEARVFGGYRDESDFIREALEAACNREEAEMERARVVAGGNRLGATRTTVPDQCLHPLTARHARGTTMWCSACDSKVRDL